MRVRLFPKLLPPPLSWMFWWIVAIVAVVLYGGAALHWFFDGPGDHIIRLVADLKFAFILIVALGGGGARWIKRTIARDRDDDAPPGSGGGDPAWPPYPDGTVPGEQGIGGTPPARPIFVNPSRSA